jgi:hypothetical protein
VAPADWRSLIGQLILNAALGRFGVVSKLDLCFGKQDRQFAEFSGDGVSRSYPASRAMRFSASARC